MLPVKPIRQTPGYCGPASLKIVLEYYGLRKSERALARLSGAARSRGVGAQGLARAAQKLGFRARILDLAGISDIRRYVLRERVPVIVDWFSTDDGHYSVVVHIDRKHIWLQDPEIGRIRRMSLAVFMRVWFDFPGKFLRVKKDMVVRRMIAVTPRGSSRGSVRS